MSKEEEEAKVKQENGYWNDVHRSSTTTRKGGEKCRTIEPSEMIWNQKSNSIGTKRVEQGEQGTVDESKEAAKINEHKEVVKDNAERDLGREKHHQGTLALSNLAGEGWWWHGKTKEEEKEVVYEKKKNNVVLTLEEALEKEDEGI
ncbi:hypothetical protein PIB30_007761 [Stylosanthes scabra]|uniref:Uncharacterized protein n=1 Tax=Stylosanthes scabra TaxID=79078 RepID=A0ABU6Y4S0_9FABA|nr:hypothetical protein [Stylosanthes scabra]